jgi:triacylglycerol lipase
MALGGIGGHFRMPEWIQDLTGSGGAAVSAKDAPQAAPQPPAPAAKRGLLQSVEQMRAKIASAVKERLGPDSIGKIGWLQGKGAPTRDVSARFEQLNAAAAAGENTLPADAKDHVYLTVPGIFTERYPGYLNDNTKRLKDLGLDAREVGIDSDASVETNAKVIRDTILEASKSGKKVVLIGHSKGGVDATAALSLYPELKPHVRAVVAMQTPFGGSPIASDVLTCPQAASVAECIIGRKFRGNPQSLRDISYDGRQAFLAKHPYPTDIPTVSLASSSHTQVSVVAAASNYIRARYGEKSDGLVPAKDAIIPGSNVVHCEDMDHAGGAMRGPGGLCKRRPADVTQALVTLALTTPPPG